MKKITARVLALAAIVALTLVSSFATPRMACCKNPSMPCCHFQHK